MAERNYRRDDKIRQTGRYAYIDGSTVRKLQTRPVPEKRETERRQEQPRRRKRTPPRMRRIRHDSWKYGRVPKQDATVHVHCRCICVTLSFLESQE